ncbi:Ger(x)C family spore germination protein [Neobacillus novalis]|uniref:Ger(X)C family spore germination protein n=1 Tax=Neobacillus novalis TaxID=220687 RepID=A0AA95MLC8_9BACI|nr:Ger(x)C family spore germination protein [Neobacillus novalis]WHY84324.1 Ger(x)C family spore germination protein [Neobacillus novalis]
MSNRLKWKMLSVLFSCVMLISGCVEKKQLEKLGLSTAVGYDLEKENHIRGTVVIHKFDPLAKNLTEIITVEANTSKTLRQKQNLETDQKLVSGQLRCVIYSKELAERGIVQLVDALDRDPTIGNTVYLTVTDGKASTIMNMDKENQKIDLGTYLYNLIKQNVESEQLILPTLFEFNHRYNDHGKDPVLPILKLKNGNVILSGVALFQDDRAVAELKGDNIFYLKILSDKFKSGTHEMGFDRSKFKKLIMNQEGNAFRTVYKKLYLNIDNIRSHTKIKLVDKKNLRFKVAIKIQSRLLEATEPLDLAKPANIEYIEKVVGKEMEKEIKKLLIYFQKNKVDPIGIGNEYIAHNRGKMLTKKEWRDKYKDVKFDVHVQNTIVKSGVID